MGEVSSNSILERKAAQGRETHQAKAMTVAKALRLSIAKVAEKLHDLALAAIGIKAETVQHEQLEERFGENTLLLLLDGPRRQTGIAIVDGSLAGALVQQQTTASVRPESDESRPLTTTDAALAAPLLDGLLERVARTVEAEEDMKIFAGFRFGAMAQDARLAMMALEANEYNHFSLTLDVARGARQSTLGLYFPIADDDAIMDDIDEYDDDSAEQKPKQTLAGTVLQLEADLNMVLCKMRLPLRTLERLQPGQSIQLPPNAFPDVAIAGVDGTTIGKGVVGQIDGQRAVQLKQKPNYAASPMRRQSDKENLDLPDMVIDDRRQSVPALTMSDVPGSSDAGLPDLPNVGVPALPEPDLPDLPDLPAEEPSGDLPELDDLPDLNDLPELDDLPDLSELANLDDLPDLKMA